MSCTYIWPADTLLCISLKCKLHKLCTQFDLEPHRWTCSLLLLRVLRDVIGSCGEAGHSRSITCYSMTTLKQPVMNAYTSQRGCSCKVKICSVSSLLKRFLFTFPSSGPLLCPSICIFLSFFAATDVLEARNTMHSALTHRTGDH